MLSGPYEIGSLAFRSRSVVTTTTPVGAFRGAGRPEATFALERGMDMVAAELGMDPVDLRRRNLIPADRFPYKSPTGAVYDSGDYTGALDRALAAAGYEELRAEQQGRRQRGDAVQLGIGVSTYVEITNPLAGPEPGRVRVELDGSATVFTGTGPHGQGHETSWSMIAADRLGIPIERIKVVYGDTDKAPAAPGTGGSRSLQTAGVTVSRASEAVVEQAKHVAADLLEAAPEDVVLDTEQGQFHVAGTPTQAVTWQEVTRSAGQPLEAEAAFEAGPSFPFGAHLAVVEVDTETGAVRLQRLVACDDCGTILNPLIVEGQVHGGAAQGIAQALFEEVTYDEDGNPLTSTFADYMIVTAAELPSFEVIEQETPSPNNELGAKGVGESGTIGSTPAVVNAVLDALAPFGIRHLDMPLSPMRVWQAIRQTSEART
jgi:carbon-monoxide dehydrogenase large subunit